MNVWWSAVLVAAASLVWPRGRPQRRSVPVPPPPAERRPVGVARLPTPVVLDLLCAALESGLGTTAALTATLEVCAGSIDPSVRDGLLAARVDAGRWRAPVVRPGRQPGELLGLTRALYLADRTGASVAPLLRRAAADARAERRRRTAIATGRLGVRLVLPLGLTTLPSFVLLGVAPVVLGLARQMLDLQ